MGLVIGGRPRERLAGPCSGVYPPARWQPAPGLRVALPFCIVVVAHPECARRSLAGEEGIAPETSESSQRVRVPSWNAGSHFQERVLRGRKEETGDRDHEA